MTRRPRRSLALLATIALVSSLALTACSPETPDGDLPSPLVDSEAPTSGPTDGATDPSAGTTVDDTLEVVSWGGDGEHLAVVVRNVSDRQIAEADVLIAGLDDAGNPVTFQRGSPGDRCCSIVGLAPGEEYGLFAELDRPVTELDDVQVRFDRIQQARATEARFTVDEATLEKTADDAVVVADLRPRGRVGPHIVGQAVLVDGEGRTVGIISGHFYCFTEGRSRQVRMELTRPAPPGARLGQVMAHPVPPGTPLDTEDQCSTPGRTS